MIRKRLTTNEFMFIVVGLGNPGREYEKTRHNVGFMVVDALHEHAGGKEWRSDAGSEADVSEATVGHEKVLLLKPQTFMNLSGKSVQHVRNFYKVDPAKIFVVYDDADLPLGTIRIRLGGSSGGHNGVQSVIDALGTEQFPHVRIGISTPERDERKVDAKDFVLSAFTSAEKKMLRKVIDRAVLALHDAITNGVEHAISKWNGAQEIRNSKSETKFK